MVEDVNKKYRDKMIAAMIAEINSNHSASVNKVAENLKIGPFDTFLKKQIVAALEKDGEYKSIQINDGQGLDFYVAKDPSFKILKNSFKLQKTVGWVTIITGGLSAIFIVISTLQQCKDRTSQHLKVIKETAQKTQESIDKIATSQQEVVLPIQKIADSLSRRKN
jgi:hypothetical protein